MKRYVFVIFLSCFVWGSLNQKHSDLFAKHLTEQDYENCYQVLDDWKTYGSLDRVQQMGLYACVMLSQGDILEGKELLSRSLSMISPDFISNDLKQKLLSMLNENAFVSAAKLPSSSDNISLCKRTQPKGVCFRYWLGVSQVVAGCLVMPFSPATGSTLIASGVTTVAHAAADCMDNKERMERHREEMNKKHPRDRYDF